MMKIIQITFILFFVNTAYAIETLAPFGFHWDENKKKHKKIGIVFDKCSVDKNLTICETKKAKESISFAGKYKLVYVSKLGLQKVVMLSNDITGDITGSKGKGLYKKIKNSLIKKYGEPIESEQIGLYLYDKDDEFYQCLAYSGCGIWLSFWEPSDGGFISLTLEGVGRGKGHLKLTYESKKWASIVKKNESKESAKNDDGL